MSWFEHDVEWLEGIYTRIYIQQILSVDLDPLLEFKWTLNFHLRISPVVLPFFIAPRAKVFPRQPRIGSSRTLTRNMLLSSCQASVEQLSSIYTKRFLSSRLDVVEHASFGVNPKVDLIDLSCCSLLTLMTSHV